MSIVLQGSTSGSITLQEPAIAGSTVLDLPATSGTILTSASAISASSITTGTLPKAQLPTGSVLQVVQATTNTQVSNSSSTWTSTGLTASITPTSSSNKILVRFSPNLYFGSSNSIGAGFRIDRNGTNVYQTGAVNNVAAVTLLGGNLIIEYLDSPATTSAVTYTLQFNCPFANSPVTYPTINTTTFNGSNLSNQSTTILMEISA